MTNNRSPATGSRDYHQGVPKRIAIKSVSDIHGNFHAFEAVMEAISKENAI
jgi:hypothetical protein